MTEELDIFSVMFLCVCGTLMGVKVHWDLLRLYMLERASEELKNF